MRVLFCCNPLDRRTVDPAYEPEAAAAQAVGLACDLISYEALVDEGDADSAAKRVAEPVEPEPAIYRGWMLRPGAYARLYDALGRRGVWLINDPAAYQHCHYLPESYPVIQAHTPRTVWVTTQAGLSMERVVAALHGFGASPLVIKDFVKSRKHEWEEACYIPCAADLAAVERVVTRFLELQGDDLEGGLVFREYVTLEPLGRHPQSGMPLAREHRLFFLDGELLSCQEYWAEADYGELVVPVEQFAGIARRVRSRFFTMDVARRIDGEWIIVELGDGQVSALPEDASPQAFYEALMGHTRARAFPLSP